MRQKPRSIYSLAAFDMRKFDIGCGIEIITFDFYQRMTGLKLTKNDTLNKRECTLGTTVILGGHRMIAYDSEAPGGMRRINWTIAHEAGHHLLCHAGQTKLAEAEADIFASELLLPEPVVRILDSLYGRSVEPQILTAWFNVSLAAAYRRRAELDRSRYIATASGEELCEMLFPAKIYGKNEITVSNS
jgi:Predicted Zn peptidase